MGMFPEQAPYNPAAYQQMIGQLMQQAQMMQQGQMMRPPMQTTTRPTIRADIVQVDSEEAGRTFPVAAGDKQIMITKDEQTILIKEMLGNGQSITTYYDARPQAAPEQGPDMSAYVTRDELRQILTEAMGGQSEEAGHGAV